MTSEIKMNSSQVQRRNIFQFSLRTYLISVSVVSALLGSSLAWLLRPTPVGVLGPVRSAAEETLLPPPTDDEVLKALHSSIQFRANVQIKKELIDQYADAERVFPLIGPAVLHHAIYKCTVSDGLTKYVVMIDHNHLHMTQDLSEPAD